MAWGELRRTPMVAIPMVILLIFVVVAFTAHWTAPYGPEDGDLIDQFIKPAWLEGGSPAHIFGTDRFGRDIFSRIMHGARVSLVAAVTVIALAATAGTALGILSGYLGGMADAVVMRVVDLMMAIPPILMALVLVVILGPSFTNVILVIALLMWSRFARVIRGEVLSLKQRDFVALAKVAGCSQASIMARHIFPNIMNSLLVMATFQIGFVILLEASLSYLGVGIPPPTPAWGVMVSDGRDYIGSAWWLSLFPGVAILLVVIAVNLLGDWLRDRLDPRMRQV
ncbi:MAG: ABC transporter permease [Chloroflexi bacterium]|nr:ABC transporter permease [Chloroflexota bacterium]